MLIEFERFSGDQIGTVSLSTNIQGDYGVFKYLYKELHCWCTVSHQSNGLWGVTTAASIKRCGALHRTLGSFSERMLITRDCHGKAETLFNWQYKPNIVPETVMLLWCTQHQNRPHHSAMKADVWIKQLPLLGRGIGTVVPKLGWLLIILTTSVMILIDVNACVFSSVYFLMLAIFCNGSSRVLIGYWLCAMSINEETDIVNVYLSIWIHVGEAQRDADSCPSLGAACALLSSRTVGYGQTASPSSALGLWNRNSLKPHDCCLRLH